MKKLIFSILLVFFGFLFVTNLQASADSLWNVVPSPNTGTKSFLAGVTAISSTDVWAVGTYFDASGIIKPLAEHWDGTSWNIINIPPIPGDTGSGLNNVTAISSTDVWAVGAYDDSNGIERPLTEHWDGTLWNFISSPNQGSGDYLNGVTAISSTDVWAVGAYGIPTGLKKTLTEHWDGTSWSVIPTPDIVGDNNSTLLGITAISSTDVWAVGAYLTNNSYQPLAEHWDGASWNIITTPLTNDVGFELGITAISSTDVWAVAGRIGHWDGTSWSIIPKPQIGIGSIMQGLTAISSTDVWAAGYYNNSSRLSQSLIEHWDGTSWSIIPSPNLGPNSNLRGIAAISSTDVWAVGKMTNSSGQNETLIEHYSNASNLPPSIQPISNSTINESSTYSATGSFTDPNSTSWTATVNYGDGSVTQNLPLNPDNSFNLSNLYKEEGTYTLTVKVTDNQGATGTATATIIVNDVKPIVNTISVITNPVIVNNSTSATATFTDQGVLDSQHTAQWNWGDGSTTSGAVTEPNGSTPGSVSDNHTYTQTGVYTITLTVSDNEGISSLPQAFQYVSVYNPTPQGLFSGARIFTSPAGAYPQDTTLTGRVMFGVSVKYNNTNQPTGNVSMDFKDASLSFVATSINSLVTSNGMATVTGSGTVNGTSGYTFFATGLDSSQGGPDIRFQIKDPSNNITYDSQQGAAETATPTASVTGNVVVH